MYFILLFLNVEATEPIIQQEQQNISLGDTYGENSHTHIYIYIYRCIQNSWHSFISLCFYFPYYYIKKTFKNRSAPFFFVSMRKRSS
jgi:hypothetical protein